MLVLSRQRNEEIVIGDDVRVVVVDIQGGKVRLGIAAPKDVSIHRREVYDALRLAASLEPAEAVKGGAT
jgi:carbon storage regulator